MNKQHRLARLVKKRGKTMAQFAEAAGVHPVYLSSAINHRIRPGAGFLAKVRATAKAWGGTLDRRDFLS